MPPLDPKLRNTLEKRIVEARDASEAAARTALKALAVHEREAYPSLSDDDRRLRNLLRKKARVLGGNAERDLSPLVEELAYVRWHRFLFARFLAENELLVHPEYGVSVSMADCAELASEEGDADRWMTASRYAQSMLPAVFRGDDPLLSVRFFPEGRRAMIHAMEGVPKPAFSSDDGLGWTYQFWQTKAKKEVNASGRKISGSDLPAVTQLFTEDYMVEFLLHNSLGAWWASRTPDSPLIESFSYLRWNEDVAETSGEPEDELHREPERELDGGAEIHGAGGVGGGGIEAGVPSESPADFRASEISAEVHAGTSAEVRASGTPDGASDDGASDGTFAVNPAGVSDGEPSARTPAAGTFDGWPDSAAGVTVLDPCSGSGHFLVAAAGMLAEMRGEEEGLSEAEAAEAVLRDNIFGLELDGRCAQIAAFSLALWAWKRGGHRPIPNPRVAWSGTPAGGSEDEWAALAKGDLELENTLRSLHELFRDAPDLGSLIDPSRVAEGSGFAKSGTTMLGLAPIEEVGELLDRALERTPDPTTSTSTSESASNSASDSASDSASPSNSTSASASDSNSTSAPDSASDSPSNSNSATSASDSASASDFASDSASGAPASNFASDSTSAASAASNSSGAAESSGSDGGSASVSDMSAGSASVDGVFAGAARGISRAAALMRGKYTLVATNVPYLARGKQADTMKDHLDTYHASGKADLATAFVLRCADYVEKGGSYTLVTPQNWLFLGTYKNLRRRLLETQSWNLVARLGSGAFETIGGEVVNVALLALTNTPADTDHRMSGLDVSESKTPREKADALRAALASVLPQSGQLENPDARVSLDVASDLPLLEKFARSFQGIKTGDDPQYRRNFWESPSNDGWRGFQSTVDAIESYSGRECVIDWNGNGSEMARLQGMGAWNLEGVAVSQMRKLPTTLFSGDIFDSNVSPIIPKNSSHLPAIWAFCSSSEYVREIRKIDQKMSVANSALVKVPFDLECWRKVAEERYPDGLPEPYSDDPTQWLFHGHPARASEGTALHVAAARLLGYRWPAEADGEAERMGLSREGREWVARAAARLLDGHTDPDGIVCLPAVAGERPAAERLRALLAAAWEDAPDEEAGGGGWTHSVLERLLSEAGSGGGDIGSWLWRDFFKGHARLFHNRPFIWHITDGRRDGFSALVNYHKLDYRLLGRLIYTYLGAWIETQKTASEAGETGADLRLAAAEDLQKRLIKIQEGEKPYDIFIRWKAKSEQPIGWRPDTNDGVRLNIRPFVEARVLRSKFTINWRKDRGRTRMGRSGTTNAISRFRRKRRRGGRLAVSI